MAGALELQLCDVFDLVVAERLFLFLRVDFTSLHFLFKFASRILVSKAQKSGKSLQGQWRFKSKRNSWIWLGCRFEVRESKWIPRLLLGR